MNATVPHLNNADVKALIWVIDAWGHAVYRDGFEVPADLLDADNYEVGRRQSGRRAAIIEARDTAKDQLLELVDDGRIPTPVADEVIAALEPWSENRWNLGQAVRYALQAAGQDAEMNQAKHQAEELDQQLRNAWVEPLYVVVDGPRNPPTQ